VIVKGIIESDPSGGTDWHVIRGTMKVDPSQQIIDPTNSLVNNSGTQSFQAEGKLTESNYDALRNAGLSEKRSSTMMKDILVGFLPFPVDHWTSFTSSLLGKSKWLAKEP
jgi:hypothetical protein